VKASCLLHSFSILIDHLPPFKYSPNTPVRLLSNKYELNRIIREHMIKLFNQVTWVDPPRGLSPKMAFYVENFLELRNGLIVRPPTHFSIGCKLFESLLGNFGLVLIIFGLKLTTTSPKGVGSTNSAIFMRPRQRSTSSSSASSITRLENVFTTFSGSPRTHYLGSFVYQTKDA
jgi:hypothetical protein